MGGRGTALDRNSGTFGAAIASAGGGYGLIEGYGKAEQALARRIFGKNMSAAQLATLAGGAAFNGANIEFSIVDGRLRVDLSHKYISDKDGMTRFFYKDAKGRTVINNDSFFLSKSAQGKGLGTESFASQVRAARDSKVSHISTFALRNDVRADKAVGYKVWADLGYNGVLSGRVQRAWEGRNPLARFDGKATPRTIRELYNTRGGRALWHEKGESQAMVFDLKRGSVSIKALNKYLKGKGKKTI